MSIRQISSIVRLDLLLLRREPVPLVILFLMPVLVMAFILPAAEAALIAEGRAGVNGAEQAVPGIAVLFAFLVLNAFGYGFFREHGWNTWVRLRASSAPATSLVAAKMATPALMSLCQLAFLFGAGALLFDLRPRGSVPGLAVVACAFVVALSALAMALVAICRTLTQLNALVFLGMLLMAGLGGALTTPDMLPSWARTVAPGTPSHWAMRGFREVILDGAGARAVLPEALVLLGFAAVFGVVAAGAFRADQPKISFA